MSDPTVLARELRGLSTTSGIPPAVADRLRMLAAEADALTVPVTSELDVITAGLDPAQESRARALDAAVTICERATMPDDFVVLDYEALIVGAADRLAAYIRDGSRP